MTCNNENAFSFSMRIHEILFHQDCQFTLLTEKRRKMIEIIVLQRLVDVAMVNVHIVVSIENDLLGVLQLLV